MALQTYGTPTRRAPSPVRHRCEGMGDTDATIAHIVELPEGPRVQVTYRFFDADAVSRKFPHCPGCGSHASFLAAGGAR